MDKQSTKPRALQDFLTDGASETRTRDLLGGVQAGEGFDLRRDGVWVPFRLTEEPISADEYHALLTPDGHYARRVTGNDVVEPLPTLCGAVPSDEVAVESNTGESERVDHTRLNLIRDLVARELMANDLNIDIAVVVMDRSDPRELRLVRALGGQVAGGAYVLVDAVATSLTDVEHFLVLGVPTGVHVPANALSNSGSSSSRVPRS